MAGRTAKPGVRSRSLRQVLPLTAALVFLLAPVSGQAILPGASIEPPSQQAIGWLIEIVDSNEADGVRTSLALDSSGSPHISYCGNRFLKYAHQDALGWHVESVDHGGWWCGSSASLVLDAGGFPHISYACSETLRYAYLDTTGWHTETVDTEPKSGSYNSMALDTGGYPHIAYHYSSPAGGIGRLKYAYQDAVGWHIETVDSEGRAGSYASLALDANDYPHISYYCTDYSELKYAYLDAAGWHIETVDSDGLTGQHTSLALDSSGYPHISYFDNLAGGDQGNLQYAYKDTVGWHIEFVCGRGRYTSIALDANGNPHISFFSYLEDDLKYAFRDTAGWHIETVTSAGEVGTATSLALDANGYPRISYYDETNADLEYAYCTDLQRVFLPLTTKATP